MRKSGNEWKLSQNQAIVKLKHINNFKIKPLQKWH